MLIDLKLVRLDGKIFGSWEGPTALVSCGMTRRQIFPHLVLLLSL